MAEWIYRCSDGHLYTAPVAKVILLSVHLGVGNEYQRCPVDHHWRMATRVSRKNLSESDLNEARQHRF